MGWGNDFAIGPFGYSHISITALQLHQISIFKKSNKYFITTPLPAHPEMYLIS